MPFGRSFYPKCLAATWLHTFEAGIAPAGVEPLTLTALVLCYYESQSALLQSLLTVGFTLREEKCCSSQLWVKAEVLKSLLLKQKNTWDAVIIVNRFNIVKKNSKRLQSSTEVTGKVLLPPAALSPTPEIKKSSHQSGSSEPVEPQNSTTDGGETITVGAVRAPEHVTCVCVPNKTNTAERVSLNASSHVSAVILTPPFDWQLIWADVSFYARPKACNSQWPPADCSIL